MDELDGGTRMFERLDEVSWTALAQPPWNEPDSIRKALLRLANSASNDQAQSAYHRVLYSLGNNHAGTYYPAVLLALPFLGEILEHGSPFAREGALEVLIDLVGSFYPEPGFGTVDTDLERGVSLRSLVVQRVLEWRAQVESLGASPAATPGTANLVPRLLALLDQSRD